MLITVPCSFIYPTDHKHSLDPVWMCSSREFPPSYLRADICCSDSTAASMETFKISESSLSIGMCCSVAFVGACHFLKKRCAVDFSPVLVGHGSTFFCLEIAIWQQCSWSHLHIRPTGQWGHSWGHVHYTMWTQCGCESDNCVSQSHVVTCTGHL